MHIKLIVSIFILSCIGVYAQTNPATAGSVLEPGSLAVYYGMPSKVNGSQTIRAATAVFGQYDAVVFGDSLEFPQYTAASGQVPYYGCDQNSHFDHDNTVVIIRKLKSVGTKVYGYVSIGGESTARVCGTPGVPTPLGIPDIKARIDAWLAMGVAGIFLDEAEYGFGCPRQRQIEVIQYIHSLRLSAFINSYNPDDVFSNAIVSKVILPNGLLSTAEMNPYGLGTALGRRDIYLLEHYQVINGNYQTPDQDPGEWERANLASGYSDQYGTLIATIPSAGPAFEQGKFNYAWWSTLIYGFDFVGWGEPSYSAADNKLPFRIRPNPGRIGNTFISPVLAQPFWHDRTTPRGMIAVDSSAHLGFFKELLR